MRPIILAAAAALALSACAQGPGSIAPPAMPGGMYDAMSCQQARAERSRLPSELAALEQRQRSAATADAVGVFLLFIPMGSLTGGDVSGQIATVRGQLLALDARLGRC